MLCSENEYDFFPKDLYHTDLKINLDGNLYQVERRLDSESFGSDSTLYLDENEKIRKLVNKKVPNYEAAQFKKPAVNVELFNEIQPNQEYIFEGHEEKFVEEAKQNLNNIEYGIHTNKNNDIFDWKNWEYIEGLNGRNFLHTSWRDHFFFKVKLANQDYPSKKRVPGLRHRLGLNKLVDNHDYMARQINGYFRIDHPPENEKQQEITKFKVLKTRKHCLADTEDPKEWIMKNRGPEIKTLVLKNLREIVDLYNEFCSRRIRLQKPLDIFEICKKLQIDALLDKIKGAIITYWTLQGYMGILQQNINSVRSEELFFKIKGDSFMKVLRHAGECSYDQLMDDPVNGEFYRSIRYERFTEIPVFLEQFYQEQFSSWYAQHWLFSNEDEKQARAFPIFTDRDHRGCYKYLRAIDSTYPECVVRYQVKKKIKEKNKKTRIFWGTRSRPGFRRIQHWMKKIIKKKQKKSHQRIFNNLHELEDYINSEGVSRCRHVKGNIYYHREMERDELASEDPCRDQHSDDCLSYRDDQGRPRAFPPDLFHDAAQYALFKTFFKKRRGKTKEIVTDPAIMFRLYMSKYLHSDLDRLAYEKRYHKPGVWKTKFSTAMEPYLAALKQGHPESSAQKKDLISKFRGLIPPEDIIRLETENQPPTELRTSNLQDCIASWIEKPVYMYVKTGESLIDTPNDSPVEGEIRTHAKGQKSLQEKRQVDFNNCIQESVAKCSKYERNVRSEKYLEKLDVTLKRNDIVILCISNKLHYVGKLKSDDIKLLITAAEKFTQGNLDKAEWNVKKVVTETIPLIMEMIEMRRKREENPCYDPVEELDKISPEDMMVILEQTDPFKSNKCGFFPREVCNLSNKESAKKSSRITWGQIGSEMTPAHSRKTYFQVNHSCKARKDFGSSKKYRLYRPQDICMQSNSSSTKDIQVLSKLFGNEIGEIVSRIFITSRNKKLKNISCSKFDGNPLCHKDGSCQVSELMENKIRYYVLKLFSDELDHLVCRQLVPSKKQHLLRFFNHMIKNRMKTRNEYKYWSKNKLGENILNIFPRTFDMNHICEKTPQKFSYSHLTEYKFTRVSNIPIDKAVNYSNIKRKILNKYKFTHKAIKKCIENSIKNTIRLAKRKALLRIALMSIEKTQKVKNCIDEKRRKYLKGSLLHVEQELIKEKLDRKTLYMTIPPISTRGEQPYLVKLNDPFDSMKKELEEFRQKNEYVYLYYMAMDLLGRNEKDSVTTDGVTKPPSVILSESQTSDVGDTLMLDFETIREEFFDEQKETRIKAGCKKYKKYFGMNNNKWHFSKATPVKEKPKGQQSEAKTIARYKKRFEVLVNDNTKKVFALPRLYKFIQWTKYTELIQRYFLRSHDLTARKGAYVVQFGTFALKGCEKVVKKCLHCLRMFGIKKRDLEFALIVFAKLQLKESDNIFYDELNEMREYFGSLCEKHNAFNELRRLEEKIKKENNSLPDFVTWHENDEDYHLKTYVGGSKKHKTMYESFFYGLNCKKNKIKKQKGKFHDLKDYQYYNYKIDTNFNKKNDYSSEEGDENENHYLDNLCSCGVEKEITSNIKSSHLSDEDEVQVEYEILDESKNEKEKNNNKGLDKYAPQLNSIKITSFKKKGVEEKRKNDTNNSVQTMSPSTMVEIRDFFSRSKNGFNKNHVEQLIEYMNGISEDVTPDEFRFDSSPVETFDEKGTSRQTLQQTFYCGRVSAIEDSKRDGEFTSKSNKLADKYFYTEYVNSIPTTEKEVNVSSKEMIKPLQLEKSFNFCRQITNYK